MIYVRLIMLNIAALAIACLPARAQSPVEKFYGGKQVQIRIGSGAGSGYDLAGRLVAPFLSRYLPGKPTVVVENEPGAGGLTLMNELANSLPKDGTVVAVVPNGMPTAPLFSPDTARFDTSKLGWIGTTAPETDIVMAWHTAPVQTYADLFTKEFLVGGIAAGTATVDMPLVTNAFAGTKFKLISGYESTGQVDLAMERGEVQGQAAIGWISAKSHNQAWLKDGTVKIIAQYGFEKNPDLLDVPLFGIPSEPTGRQAMNIMIARQEFGRPFLTSPGVPTERLAALRQAFDRTMEDPEFLAAAKKADFEVRPLSGQRLQELAAQVVATDPSVAKRLAAVLAPSPKTK